MKKEYELTPEELQEIENYSITRHVKPVPWYSSINAFWKEMAKKYGFVWDTAESVPGKENRFFKATPITHEKGHNS